ncbi:MAG TPA: chemotaxis response regulator protein-glutamate methylesterase [Gemmatimonadaceae bacterium]|nr:chemotaxis response regulator protein-glutamate methylesterase [Gemmatimonadaceae bacterium]
MLDVLVVDDSAVVREVMSLLLSPHRGFRVATASDPLIAMDKIRRSRPDVIVLDLEMPRMDGLTFLRHVMAFEEPIPVVVCSGLAQSGTEAALRALEEGAIEVIAKPQLGVRGFLEESATSLAEVVRGAARARVRRRRSAGEWPGAANGALVPLPRSIAPSTTTDKVVVIGASTGGTEALRVVLDAMPPDAPGIVVVQHMPAGFTTAFARRLNEVCRIEVTEAVDGHRVTEGRALIAPGNRHTEVERSGAHYIVRVSDGPAVSRHRPSVDVLFRSAARSAGRNATGVIMTGMGSDGAEGLLELRGAGGATIAQDEATCIVFGMPGAAVARGAVEDVVPLDSIAAAILSRTAGRAAARSIKRDGAAAPPTRAGS